MNDSMIFLRVDECSATGIKDEALSRSECFWAVYSLLRGEIDSFRVHSFFRLTASCATFPPSLPPDTTTGGFTTKQTFHRLFTKAMHAGSIVRHQRNSTSYDCITLVKAQTTWKIIVLYYWIVLVHSSWVVTNFKVT